MKTALYIALSTLILSFVPATAQELQADECGFGMVTNALLSKGKCMGSVPLPTPRPDMQVVSSVASQLSRSDFTYVTTPSPDGGQRQVRLVGPRFLPDATSEIHLLGKADQSEVLASG